jgi:hypothetical protein
VELMQNPEDVALIRFNVGRSFRRKLVKEGFKSSIIIAPEQGPELNRNLVGEIVVIARRSPEAGTIVPCTSQSCGGLAGP